VRKGANFQKIRPFHKNRAVNLHTIMKNQPQRLISFLVVWLTMFSCVLARGQSFSPPTWENDFLEIPLPGSPTTPSNKTILILSPYRAGKAVVCELGKDNLIETGKEPGTVNSGPMSLSVSFYTGIETSYRQQADLYYIQSGFFCKREWELEKTTHIPLRFRLGSLADCNMLEGKH
jgi:hypothetical protein